MGEIAIIDDWCRQSMTHACVPRLAGGRSRGAVPMDKTSRARELRQTMTDAERRLWRYLRRHFLGVHFRRQVPIGPYIVDFACLGQKPSSRLMGGSTWKAWKTRSGTDGSRSGVIGFSGSGITRS